MPEQNTLTGFVWDGEFIEENGGRVLCGTATDSMTGNLVQVKVRKATVDAMASDYTCMEWASGRGATDDER